MRAQSTAPTLLLIAVTAIAACTVGPQPLPPDDPFCGAPGEILFEESGAGRIEASGRWSGDATGFEVANLDSDAPSLFVDIDDDSDFYFVIDAEPTDRLRIVGAGGTCTSSPEPRDYSLETGEVLSDGHDCAVTPRIVMCRLADEAQRSCEASFVAHNICGEELTLRSARARQEGVDIELTTALPITLSQDRLARLTFTVGAGERVSQIFFIDLEGAEELTMAVTVRLEPFR